MKRFLTPLIIIAVLLTLGTFSANADELIYWADSESRTAFLDYVAAVTDPGSGDFIPETDRIAVFDLDGTLCGEQFPTYFEWMMYVQRVLDDPDYIPTNEQIEVAQEILSFANGQTVSADLEEKQFLCGAEVFADMSVEEYRLYVKNFLQNSADRFDNLRLADAWFRPTVEAAKYLQSHGFTVYVVSGTDRDACRIMISEILGIPYRQIIGSDSYTKASGQGENGYLDYQYTESDTPVRTADTIIKNVKSSKPMQISQEIGQKPVIAFGNSTGDTSMFMYTTKENPYRSIAFCVVPDDDEREVAYPDRVDKLTSLCEQNGWHTISMKKDFVTIYGENITLDKDSTPWMDKMLKILNTMLAEDAA